MKQRLTSQRIIDALGHTKGMVSLAARRLGCARSTIYDWAEKHPEIKDAIEAERETMTDLAEISLFKQVQDGQGWAVQFYLRTQGKNRGYGDQVNVQHSGDKDNPIRTENRTEVTLVNADDFNREFAALLGVGNGTGDPDGDAAP
jgi:transposase-like protein